MRLNCDAVYVGFECLIIHFFKIDTQARQRFFFTFYWHETQPCLLQASSRQRGRDTDARQRGF